MNVNNAYTSVNTCYICKHVCRYNELNAGNLWLSVNTYPMKASSENIWQVMAAGVYTYGRFIAKKNIYVLDQ